MNSIPNYLQMSKQSKPNRNKRNEWNCCKILKIQKLSLKPKKLIVAIITIKL